MSASSAQPHFHWWGAKLRFMTANTIGYVYSKSNGRPRPRKHVRHRERCGPSDIVPWRTLTVPWLSGQWRPGVRMVARSHPGGSMLLRPPSSRADHQLCNTCNVRIACNHTLLRSMLY